VIRIDLSALGKDRPKVHSARLLAERDALTGADDEARVKVEVYGLTEPFKEGGKAAPAGEPLKLLPPWCASLDATAAVRKALGKGAALELYVKAFPKWRQETTELEVVYEGKPPAKMPPAVKGLKALHRAGQTFITWQEIEDPFGGKPVALGDLKKARERLESARRVRYRLYRSEKPISAGNLAEAALLAEVGPFSGYNVRGVCLNQLIYQHQLRAAKDEAFARTLARGPFRGYSPSMPQMGEVVVRRLAVADDKPLPAGTGLYVHHPAQAGRAYYAVVTAIDGTANTTDFATLGQPVAEKPGPGVPVRQGVEDLKVFYDYPGQRQRYVQWTAPPLSNLPNQYHNWGVYVPPPAKAGKPAALGIFFHDWQCLYLKPRWPHPADMVLVSGHDGPRPSFAYGYHESLGTLRAFGEGAIHDYTARRIDAFVEWMCGHLAIDKARMSCHGSGVYGGSSAIAYALRHPQRFALVVAGAFDADPKSVEPIVTINRRRHRTHAKALEAIWGQKAWDLKTADGKSIWADRDLVAFVREHVGLHLPFLSLGTGSQHATWPQENALMKALWAAKQPFWTDFTWGGQAPKVAPLSARRDRVILSAVPNAAMLKRARWYNHDRWQKAAMGYWSGGAIGSGAVPTDVVDTPDRLELTGRIDGHVTIRNVQKFKLKPGEKVRWRVKTGRRDEPSGVAAADADGLLTIRDLSLRGRLIVTRASAEPATRKGTNP